MNVEGFAKDGDEATTAQREGTVSIEEAEERQSMQLRRSRGDEGDARIRCRVWCEAAEDRREEEALVDEEDEGEKSGEGRFLLADGGEAAAKLMGFMMMVVIRKSLSV